MATEQPGFKYTLEAAADLSAHQYKFVKLDSNGRAAAIAADTDIPCGVLQNKPNALGVAAEIMATGISKVQGDADLARGAQVGPSADGQAAARVAGTDVTKYVAGQVLTDNSVAGGICSVLLNCLTPHRAT